MARASSRLSSKSKSSRRTIPVRSSNPRYLVLALVFAGLFVIGGVMYLRSIHAAGALNTISNYLTNKSLNAKAGGKTIGTPVIAWTSDDDANEYFAFAPLTHVCGGGKVTSNCHFNLGSGMNTRYLGDQIVQIDDLAAGKCLGAGPSLQNCNDS